MTTFLIYYWPYAWNLLIYVSACLAFCGVVMVFILIDNWFVQRKLRRSAVKGE